MSAAPTDAAAPSGDANAAPRRTPGSKARSGNGMTRSRACILSGAAKCIARYGTRKTTMGDIAREGGTAKATVYNHFRTKPDIYAALLDDEVDDLLAQVAALPAPAGSAASVVEALAFAAEWLSEHPVLAALREREPELAARLARPSGAPAWQRVRQAALQRVSLAVAAGALHPQTDPGVAAEALLRWAVSHVTWPAAHGTAEAAARQVVHGLLAAPFAPPSVTVPEAAPYAMLPA
ncbi:MAG TPA: helix-turn-helix domain-containing protein [Mycobacteriales bacterium]|jgi:AcrR family transcriptional regulator|nr:helix-turn-helix domain-containing protein [Mycobacteriales bacterium]